MLRDYSKSSVLTIISGLSKLMSDDNFRPLANTAEANLQLIHQAFFYATAV